MNKSEVASWIVIVMLWIVAVFVSGWKASEGYHLGDATAEWRDFDDAALWLPESRDRAKPKAIRVLRVRSHEEMLYWLWTVERDEPNEFVLLFQDDSKTTGECGETLYPIEKEDEK